MWVKSLYFFFFPTWMSILICWMEFYFSIEIFWHLVDSQITRWPSFWFLFCLVHLPMDHTPHHIVLITVVLYSFSELSSVNRSTLSYLIQDDLDILDPLYLHINSKISFSNEKNKVYWVFGIRVNLQTNLYRVLILKIITLPKHKRGISFHLFWYSWFAPILFLDWSSRYLTNIADLLKEPDVCSIIFICCVFLYIWPDLPFSFLLLFPVSFGGQRF